MPYGLTSTGFVTKPATVIADEIAAAQRAAPALGADWDTSVESPQGQLNGIVVAALAELWELAGLVYRARSPRDASFAALDAVCELTGTTRHAATQGTVTLSATLNAGITLPSGSRAHVAGQPDNLWETTAAATNSGGAPAVVSVAARAVTAGAIVANAGTLTVIATPVSGWTAVTNALDADVGLAADSDPALRLRREAELQQAGSSPVDSLRAEVLAVSGVRQVVVAENDTDVTDADGLPPHSVEALVLGGTDAAVAQALWEGKAAGIYTHGTTLVAVADSAGSSRDVRFTRPSDAAFLVRATVERDAATYAGDAAVKAALLAYADTLLSGDPVRHGRCVSAVMGVAGVTDVDLRLGWSSSSLSEGSLSVGPRQRATLAVGSITVVYA